MAHGRISISVLCFLAIVLLATIKDVEGKKKRTVQKDWSKADLDALEKEWEKGDSEEELLNNFQRERRKAGAEKANQPAFDPNDPQAFLNAQGGGGAAGMAGLMGGAGKKDGPVMMFVDLLPHPVTGGHRSNEDVDLLATKWKELMLTGNVQADVYNLEDNKVLIQAKKGWQAHEVKDFALEQPETDFVTLDSQKYERKLEVPAKTTKKNEKKKVVVNDA